MSDNVRYHSKHHGKAHHTNQTVGYYDSATDPIATEGAPFQGNFFLSGGNFYTFQNYMSSAGDNSNTWVNIDTLFGDKNVDAADSAGWDSTHTTVYDNSASWTPIIVAGFSDGKSEVFTSTGDRRFESNYAIVSGANAIISIEGLVQTPVHFNDLDLTGSNTTYHYAFSANAARGGKTDIVFNTAPVVGENVEVRHFNLVKSLSTFNTNYTVTGVVLSGYKTIDVAGQSTVTAHTYHDGLTFAAGNEIAITTNPATDTITFASLSPLTSAGVAANNPKAYLTDTTTQLGIGTTAPSEALTVAGNVSADGNVYSRDRINVKAYGAVGDGTTDDTTAFHNAIADAKLYNVPVYVPMPDPVNGQYLITQTLSCHQVNMTGERGSKESNFAAYGEYPTLKGGSSLRDIVLLTHSGVSTGSISDRTYFENFMINMTNSPVSARGIVASSGMDQKTIRNIYIRDNTYVHDPHTTAQILSGWKTGIHLELPTTTVHTLYYLRLENIGVVGLWRGFYTTSNSTDGLRGSSIDRLFAWHCPQALTFDQASTNDIGMIGVQGFKSDYNSNTTELSSQSAQWGIFMGGYDNTISNVYIEGGGGPKTTGGVYTPEVFTTARNTWLNYRGGTGIQSGLRTHANAVQIIMDNFKPWPHVYTGGDLGGRLLGSRLGNDRSLFAGNEAVEVGTLGGVQTQESLLANSTFQHWSGTAASDATNVSNEESFGANSWQATKAGTNKLRLSENTGHSHTDSNNRSIYLSAGGDLTNNLVGVTQDLSACHHVTEGQYFKSISSRMEYVTIAAMVKPSDVNSDSVSQGASRWAITTDQGSSSIDSTTEENYTISYNPHRDKASIDQPIMSESPGLWWTLIHQVPIISSGKKFSISVGLSGKDNTHTSGYIDSVIVVAGRHSQYGVHAYKKTADYITFPDKTVQTTAATAGGSSGAAAWARMSGGTGTPALEDSYNVSSVVDEGTGDYRFVFTAAIAADATAVCSTDHNWDSGASTSSRFSRSSIEFGSPTTTDVSVHCHIEAHHAVFALRDVRDCHIIVFAS